MADSTKKDIIYVDVEDEITSIIEKVKASPERIVALVLPKRASVLQSIVNMKLLKRTADGAKKHLVLITSEAGLLPLAGAVGLYVARNLQSKPEIPATPAAPDDSVIEEDGSEAAADEITNYTAGDRPVGELAAAAGAPLAAAATDPIETLQLDDDTEIDDTAGPANSAAAAAAPALKKDSKLKVPNFNRFRAALVLGVLLLLVLGAGFYVATAVLPKGTITISTDTNDVNSNLSLTLDTAAKALDASKMIVPAQQQQVQKNGSQQVATTSKKNIGTAASGAVTMTAKECAVAAPDDVPAGAAVTYNNLTYITQDSTSFAFDHISGGCIYYRAAASTAITAQSPGAQYNTSDAVTFSVHGHSDVSASGHADGGTDNIVQVVAQADVDSASQKITAQNSDSVKQQLSQQLQQQGLFPITATFIAGTPATTQSANVGDQASTLTVTQSTTYTMLGAKEADLKQLVDNDVKDKIDSSKQTILSEGLPSASFKINNTSDTATQVALSTTATAGPDLKTEAIKQQVAGKKSGDIISMLKTDPGVTDVKVHFSPFWVTHAPSKPSKITVSFLKAKP